MNLNTVDIIVICITVLLNILFIIYRNRIKIDWKIYLSWFLVYFLITPCLSFNYDASEWAIITNNDGDIHDTFEGLYTFGAILRQWLIGVFELVFLSIIFRKQMT